MFGRIAAGLVHDLSHPIQNIGNSARLIARDDVDLESRETFRQTVDRELTTIRHFLDDLRNIAKPRPVERFALDVNALVGEVVESRNPAFAPGDQVVGMGGWQEYSIGGPGLRKVDTSRIPLQAYLGAVGMPGVTAWYHS